jgi:hypothetical protein
MLALWTSRYSVSAEIWALVVLSIEPVGLPWRK